MGGSRPMMPLSMASAGLTFRIQQLRGARKLTQRLVDLGLNPGATIQVMKNDLGAPMILGVKGEGRLALDRGMAHQIVVNEVKEDFEEESR